MFRRKRCAYCGRIPVMEHRKAARTECARNSAQLFRVRCSCGNQTEWGLATSGEVRREAFRWGELKRCRMCRKIPISRITPCMNSDYTPVAYWQIEIRCNRHADCDLIMQTQNDISLAAKRLAERWNWENAVYERGYITAFPEMSRMPGENR